MEATEFKDYIFGMLFTGAMPTDAGLVQPSNTQDYLEAALNNLTAPLASLTGFQKQAISATPFKCDEIDAALLLTEETNGKQHAMSSLASANAEQSVQMAAFDRCFYGFGDLVWSSTSSWDGDFNDVTVDLA